MNNMQVKVIKAINGLEEGDILRYNEKNHKYELMKQDEEISDNGYKSVKTLHSYSKNMLSNQSEYFTFIDEYGQHIKLNEDIKKEVSKKESKEIDQIRNLEQKIKDLEQQLNDRFSYKPFEVYCTYNPFKSFFLY